MIPALAALVLASAADALTLTPAQFWHTPYGVDDWIPLVGDADGDGRADLIAVSPGGDTHIEMARTSALGKPVANAIALKGFGANAVAAACGPFKRANADALALFADGSLRLAWGMKPGTAAYEHNDLVGTIPREAMPKGPVRTVVADFDGDDRADVLMLDADGRLLLLRGAPNAGFAVVPLAATLPGMRRIAAGTLGGAARGELVWLDETGAVWRATVSAKGLGTPTLVVRAAPDDGLAVGRFRGRPGADLLVGDRLLPGGDPKGSMAMPGVPAKEAGAWRVGDVDGNGKADLVRSRRADDPAGGRDTVVHFAYEPGKEEPGYFSTSNDGLPDFWKDGTVKPGGLDLVAMGCKVGHRDLIVELERFENVDLADLRNNVNRAARYFASIPLANPDGTTGIALHAIYREPWPMKDHDRIRAHFNDLFPRPGNRGIAHMMFAERDGPLDAAIDAGVGRFNGQWPVLVHELGHQLDLVHDGFHPSGTPGWPGDTGAAIYPSLMSYTYAWGLNDSTENIGYSNGALASLVLDPRHLSERLPFPLDKVRFLGTEPYHYRMQPTPDGKGTLIDWNWNGVLGEEDVAANVNSTHGTDFGPSYSIARTDTAPALTVHGDRPLLVYGQGATLAVRAWQGRNRDKDGGRWSEPTVDYAAGITGDPTIAYVGDDASWIAYPTAKGAVLRRVTVDSAGHPMLGAATLLAGTIYVQPTVSALDGRLALLLWRSKSLPVGLRLFRPKGEGLVAGGERSLDFFSDVPVGAVAGRAGSLWVGRIERDGQPNGGRTEVLRLLVDPAGGTQVALRAFMEGTYARHRMTLLWREEGPKLPDGRIYQLSGGAGNDQYITMNTPYLDFYHGWLYHRYRQPSFTSLSAAGACLFGGDILVAFRGGNDSLDVAFYGTGATPWPTGDFDDISHVRDYGLSHSIREVTKG